MNQLAALWKDVDDLNKRHFPSTLMPIVGGGKTRKPKIMFIFINPTARNISSDPAWNGPRFPFVGTKQVWRIFHRAGMFDDELMEKINKSPWTVEFTNRVLKYLQTSSIYLTNIVKWTGQDAALPDSKKVDLFLPLLKKEIAIVRPDCIVTFGLIPFEKLAGKKIRLSEYYAKVMRTRKLQPYEIAIGSFKTKVIPCYFPVGRGNPRRATELLKMVNRQILREEM
jgi:uracil-DNA glycosylase